MDTNPSLKEFLLSIKNDDDKIRQFVHEHKRFIMSSIEECLCRFLQPEDFDEYMVGETAFKEAIKEFDNDKSDFFEYARNLIKMKLINYYRLQNNYEMFKCVLEKLAEKEDERAVENEPLKLYVENQIIQYRQGEIEHFKKELSKWGISFSDLQKSSPKEQGIHKLYVDTAKFIVERQEIMDEISQKNFLPFNEVIKLTKISAEQLEKGRNYIIAIVIIMTGKYNYLQSFMDLR